MLLLRVIAGLVVLIVVWWALTESMELRTLKEKLWFTLFVSISVSGGLGFVALLVFAIDPGALTQWR